MSEGSATSLWAIAAAGSLLLHASIGMVLYAMPIPEPHKQSRIEIDIASLTAAATTRPTAVENAALADSPVDAAVAQTRDEAQIAPEAEPLLAAVQSEETLPGSPSPALAPVGPSAEPAIAAADTLMPGTPSLSDAIAAAPAGDVAPSVAPANSAPSSLTEAAQPRELSSVLATGALSEMASVAAPLAAAPPQPEATAATEPRKEAILPAAQAPMEPAPPMQTNSEATLPMVPGEAPSLVAEPQTVEPAFRSETETIASLNESTPAIALSGPIEAAGSAAAPSLSLGSAAAQPSNSAPPGLEPVAPSSVSAAAATREGDVVLSPASAGQPAAVLPASPQPALQPTTEAAPLPFRPDTAAGAAASIKSGAIPGVLAATSMSNSSQAVAALPITGETANRSGEIASIEGRHTEVAAVSRPSAVSGTSGVAKLNRLGITDFLSGREDESCLLAIPTGAGATTASIEAFAIEEGAVERLGAEYQRLSGIPLKAQTRPVSQDQCSALTFARSLAQYPNFPLRVSLAKPAIESGQELAGVISGLRKDTVYLVVVDDEGKAELARSYSGQRASVVNFRAPMTLTSGPVSSVQLLIAIAADGPLKTVPSRPGMPAEEFFSKLATEIIANNRSIAYGMTSFVVK